MQKLNALLIASAVLASVCQSRAEAIVWTNLSGGVWNVATNWSPNRVPGWDLHNADDVCITNAGTYAIELTDGSPRYLANLVIGGAASGTQTLRLANGPLTIRQQLAVRGGGVFTNELNVTVNGTITVATNGVFCLNPSSAGNGLSGTNTLSGPMQWRSGTVSGCLTVATNGVVTLASEWNKVIQGQLVNQGIVRWVDGFYFQLNQLEGTPPRFLNETSGLFDIQGDNYFLSSYATDPRIENRGVIRKSGGTNTATIAVLITNLPGARIEGQLGSLTLLGGGDFRGVHFATTTTGAIYFSGGTVAMDYNTVNEGAGILGITGYVNLEGDVALTNLLVTGGYGTILGTNFFYQGSSVILASQGGLGDATSRIHFNGDLIWQRGVINGEIRFGAPARVSLEGEGAHYWYANVTNYGDITWTNANSIGFYYGGRLENASEGLIDIRNSSWWSDNGSANLAGLSRIVNRGVIRKRGDSGTTYLGVPFDNYGQVFVQAGQVQFSAGANGLVGGTWTGSAQVSAGAELWFSGPITLSDSVQIEGPGAVQFMYGVELTGPLSATNCFVANGALKGTNTIAGQLTLASGGELAGQSLLTGTLNWLGGFASGALTVATNGTLNLAGNSEHYLSGSLTNHGAIHWRSNSIHLGGGACLHNAADGTFDIECDSYMSVGFGNTNGWLNYGRLRKTSGTGLSAIHPAFINAGRMEIQRGTLSFAALTLATNSALVFPLAGTVAGQDYGLLQAYGLDLLGTIDYPFTNGYTPALLQRFTNLVASSGTRLTNHFPGSNLRFYATNRYFSLALASSQTYLPDDHFIATVHSVPVAQPINVSVLEDHSVNVNVGPYCTNEDGGLLGLTDVHYTCAHGSTGLPSGEPVEVPQQHTIYTPFMNYFGPDQFTYVVRDPQGVTASNTVFLTVQPVNDAPMLDVSDKWITAGRRFSFQMSAHDPDNANALVFSMGTPPLLGAAVSPEGWFSWQPSVGLQGTDALVRIVVSDGLTNGGGTFTIHLKAPAPAVITLLSGTGERQCRITGEDELDYILETAPALTGPWAALWTNSRAVLPMEWTLPKTPAWTNQFYRLRLEP